MPFSFSLLTIECDFWLSFPGYVSSTAVDIAVFSEAIQLTTVLNGIDSVTRLKEAAPRLGKPLLGNASSEVWGEISSLKRQLLYNLHIATKL